MTAGDVALTFAGHVLHLRGHLTPQPVVDDTGNILLWNGELYDGLAIAADQNDTQVSLR